MINQVLFMDRLSFRVAGVTALLGLVLVTLVLTATDEGWSEFFLVLSPIVFVPALFLLGRLLPAEAPFSGSVVRRSTGVGLAGFALLLILTLFHELDFAIPGSAFVLAMVLGGVVNMAMIMYCVGGSITRYIPLGLGILGIVAGAGWLLGIGMALTGKVLPVALASLNALLWVVSYTLFSLGLGGWLLWQTRKADTHWVPGSSESI